MAVTEFTSAGLTVGTLAEYYQYLVDRYREEFGANIRITPQSTFGQMAALKADLLQEAASVLQDSVDQMTPSKSVGAGLSELVQFNGISRNEAVYTTVTVEIGANSAGTTVVAGKLVSDGAGTQVAIDTTTAVGPNDTELVSATCTEEGAIVIDANTLTTIDTPVFGWATVNNPSAGNTGSPTESDSSLRARRRVAASATGGSSTPAIQTALADISGVTEARVFWTQPRTCNAVVEGGTDLEVATALLNTVAGGSLYAGPESYYFAAYQETVRWYRVIEIPIYIEVQVEKLAGYSTLSTGDVLMKERVVEYFEGGLEVEGELLEGQVTGKNVVVDSIIAAAKSVPACNIRGVNIDVNPNPSSSNDISIDFFQRATTTALLITITEVAGA